jgi:hypothetical protein
VANAILYDTVANVAAIPASPVDNDAVEVTNSTGIQSFTPLSGIPAGFIGDSGLSVRMVYTTSGATWNWIQYFPNDPENRYGDAITTLETAKLNLSGGTMTGALVGAQVGNIIPFYFASEAGLPSASTYHGAVAHAHDTGGLYYAHGGQWLKLGLDSVKLDVTTAASTYQTQAGMSSYLTTSAAGSTYAPLASPTFTGTVTIPAGASISGYLTTSNASTTYLTQTNAASTYASKGAAIALAIALG